MKGRDRVKRVLGILLAFSMLQNTGTVFATEGTEVKQEAQIYQENAEWEIQSFEILDNPDKQVGEEIHLQAVLDTEQTNMEYKFVWMKNNWKEWGVIQDFAETKEAVWTPATAGDYVLCVDVRDENQLVKSEHISCKIENPIWNFQTISASVTSPQKVGTEIEIQANVKGNTTGLQYKYVWMKNNWAEWGVIQDISDKKEAIFKPDQAGKYVIYADAIGIDGKKETKTLSFTFQTDLWEYTSVTTDLESPQAKNTDPITIAANTTGENQNLQYKFVWMKDNWNKWGILQNFSSENIAKWQPRETGEYRILVDVKDTDGNQITKEIPYTISDISWVNNGLVCTPEVVQRTGEDVLIEASVSGNTKGNQYKFVWMKNNWKEWGVIRDFEAANTVTYQFLKAGDYTIYVDIKDYDCKISTEKISYQIMTDIWSYDEISTDLKSPQEKYTEPIQVTADTSGETEHLEYKFVWMKNNWKEWGVLQDFSARNIVSWSPKEADNYTIYVDVKDIDGRVVNKSIAYSITPVIWNYEEITTAPECVQKKGKNVGITAETTGNTTGLQYKFVWMKDNWKSWGVIRDYSEDSAAVWTTPEEIGNYQIYIDVLDRDGEKQTKNIEYFVASQIWSIDSLEVNHGTPEQIYTELPIQVFTSGEDENLQYKYVWMKDNWKEWGVLQDFDSNVLTSWYPKTAGNYEIYANVKDVDGRIQTYQTSYEVLDAPWKLESVTTQGDTSFFKGMTAKITAETSGENDKLEYKFVYRYGNDWSDWGILQDFDTNNSIELPISKAGDYYVYIDIKDERGVVFDPVVFQVKGHDYISAGASNRKISLGKTILLYPNITGTTSGLECKYVWMKNGWSEWGVIQDHSTSASVSWKPETEGNYTIYIDAVLNGQCITKAVDVNVVKARNGWYYENGYKFYYTDDKKIEDVRGIIGWQSSYEIKINKQMSCVTVYAKDGNNGYIIPVVAFACSPGAGTPIGTFYTENKYRWQHLYGADGQFCTRITGHVLFHSPPYSSFNNHTLWPKDYNKLGTWASAGCIRLRTGDAKWIYDNCSLRTKVTIYNSSVAGPFSKPIYEKIPLTQTWDPTDPYA